MYLFDFGVLGGVYAPCKVIKKGRTVVLQGNLVIYGETFVLRTASSKYRLTTVCSVCDTPNASCIENKEKLLRILSDGVKDNRNGLGDLYRSRIVKKCLWYVLMIELFLFFTLSLIRILFSGLSFLYSEIAILSILLMYLLYRFQIRIFLGNYSELTGRERS